MTIFDTLESEVRSYCRFWPVVFDRAAGSRLYDENGRGYLDFFAGAGALNYGHNNRLLKRAIIDYIERDGVTHALDMWTVAKRDFLETFQELVLRPRELDYLVMFPGPAGTTAVEAALKLARKVTGRPLVVGFKNAFHGMTLGSLSVAGDSVRRAGIGVPVTHTKAIPFDGRLDVPDEAAAVIVETVQAEGGLNAAGVRWLRELSDLCRRRGVLLIVDDVQMGCGRTGPFFSFEVAGIQPDIVCLSKSVGGFGLPMAMTLFRPDFDVWRPGEHSGTFRGVNPAFVAAAEALRVYWRDDRLEKSTLAKGEQVERALVGLAEWSAGEPRGRGLARGLAFPDGATARSVCRAAFERGLLMETAGPDGEVVKLMPPLTVTDAELEEGLAILVDCVKGVRT